MQGGVSRGDCQGFRSWVRWAGLGGGIWLWALMMSRWGGWDKRFFRGRVVDGGYDCDLLFLHFVGARSISYCTLEYPLRFSGIDLWLPEPRDPILSLSLARTFRSASLSRSHRCVILIHTLFFHFLSSRPDALVPTIQPPRPPPTHIHISSRGNRESTG